MTTEAKGRAAVYERSQGKCEVCGRREATNVHHRQPRSAGGTWSPANLLHVCGSGNASGCHGAIEAHVDPFTSEPVDTYLMGWHVARGFYPGDSMVRLAHPVYGPAWWRLDDSGNLHWLQPWAPPFRAMEQLPTRKTGAVPRG